MENKTTPPLAMVSIDSDLWPADSGRAYKIDALVLRTLEAADFLKPFPLEVDIILTDDADIRSMNKHYRGKDKPTNVLSFPAFDPAEPHPKGQPAHLGDIVLGFETIKREAQEQSKSFEHHVMHLIVHGLLHLLGHDHEQGEAEAEMMEALEIKILEDFGVKNPYQA